MKEYVKESERIENGSSGLSQARGSVAVERFGGAAFMNRQASHKLLPVLLLIKK